MALSVLVGQSVYVVLHCSYFWFNFKNSILIQTKEKKHIKRHIMKVKPQLLCNVTILFLPFLSPLFTIFEIAYFIFFVVSTWWDSIVERKRENACYIRWMISVTVDECLFVCVRESSSDSLFPPILWTLVPGMYSVPLYLVVNVECSDPVCPFSLLVYLWLSWIFSLQIRKCER